MCEAPAGQGPFGRRVLGPMGQPLSGGARDAVLRAASEHRYW